MDHFSGIISIVLVFIAFSGLVFFLIRKNIFNIKSPTSHNENTSVRLNYDQLRKKNKELTEEIVFLENKIEKLKLRIKTLKNVIVDLEEQKNQLEKSENELKRLRKQKDETLSMVAHDIKNPAATIKNFVELLESYDLNAQEQQEVLSGLIETSSRIMKLADEFSNVVAEEKSIFNLNKEQHNINSVVEAIVAANKTNSEKKEIGLSLKKSVTIPDSKFDETKIKEVVDNLVGNAIKFSPPKTNVTIQTNLDNNYIVVEVSDNGYGLTEEEITKAFDKGSKLSTKPTGNEKSSGLGLWIAKKIVEEHDGKVWVKSKKGIGSTFAFKLPVE